jgi:protein SCO1/2
VAAGVAAPVFSTADVILTNQRGEPVQVYHDLIKGRVVVINTVFTTCTTVCPLMGVNFSRLAKILHDRGADDVRLISVSVDPEVDTPRRLAEWSSHFGGGAQWTLLTGPPANVESFLKAMRAFTANKLDHAPVVLIGNEATGDWVRASGLAPASRLAEIVLSKIGKPLKSAADAH